MTVAVFTFVLLLGSALREILPLLISGQVSPIPILRAIVYLIPFILVFALPMGMLTATLLVFGRFSADQELTAVRASGVSLLALSTPVIGLSLVLCGLSAYINMELGPRGRVAYKQMLADLKGEVANVVQLPEGRFIKDKNYIFYIGKSRKGQLQDIMVYAFKNETNSEMTVSAPTGSFSVDAVSNIINVTLFNGKFVSGGENQGVGTFESYPLALDYSTDRQRGRKARTDDLTFSELRQELRELNQILPSGPPIKLTAPQLKEKRSEFEKLRKNWESLLRFQIHRQIGFSFACFGFTLLGIPLGIRMHRRETNVGIAAALGLVAIYYSFILVGQALVGRPEFVPQLLIWVPNFLFQVIGAVLLWKANRG